jgi:hypothetical protein
VQTGGVTVTAKRQRTNVDLSGEGDTSLETTDGHTSGNVEFGTERGSECRGSGSENGKSSGGDLHDIESGRGEL